MKTEILFFTADWCGNCKTLKSALEKLGVEFTALDVDDPENYELTKAHKILSLPAVVFGDKKFVGVKDRHFLKEFFDAP